ncbi:hypothetical protein ACFL38_02970 [Candidatus Omnitrophota bacterium]
MKAYNRKKKKDTLDFEIKFYEELLQKQPNFVQALIVLADAYTKKGYYEKGLTIDKRLAELKPDDPIVFYNLACSYSLMNQIDLSLEALSKAAEHGYDDAAYMQQDADLYNVRADVRFECLLVQLRSKPPQPE